jgi:hypothetical protein
LIDDEVHRHRCLVRYVIKLRMQDRNSAHQFLHGGLIDSKGRRLRGWNAAHPESNLEVDVREQWRLGNRGAKDDWR